MRASPNGHLHLAIVFAFVLAVGVALALPISRSASDDDGGPFALSSAGAKLAEALGVKSGPLSAAITSDAWGEQGGQPYTESVAPLLVANLIPKPLLAMTGELMGDDIPSVAALTGPSVTFTIHQEGLAVSYSSTATTIGDALAEAGIAIGPGDTVTPGPDTEMSSGVHVFVEDATGVRLVVAGEGREVYTHAATVAELLDEQDVVLEGADKVTPRLGAGLEERMEVTVTTIREVTEFMDEPIQSGTVYTYDATINAGQQAVKQEGKSGHLTRQYRILRVNGEEVSSTVVAETVTLPVDKVIAIGTYTPPAAVSQSFEVSPGEQIVCSRTLDVWATWYSASTSGGSGITKTGTGVYKGIIATDPNVIPLGTKMYVPGYGFGIAADTGGGIKGNKIDLGYGESDVKDWHTGPVNICIVG